MAKMLDPTDPRFTQPIDEPTTTPADQRENTALAFIQEIEEFLEAQASDFFGRDTLEGIRTTVEKYQRVSEAQRLAFQNIRERVENGRTRFESKHGWGRRYEGR